MNDYFIEHIEIQENKHIQKLDISLNKEERQHLIFTGKNGSGKTTTLKEINTFLDKLINNGFANTISKKQDLNSCYQAIESYKRTIKNDEKQILIQNTQKKPLEKLKDIEAKIQISKIDDNIKIYNSNIIDQKNSIKSLEEHINRTQKEIQDFSKVNLTFSNQNEVYESIVKRKFILAYFEAKRDNTPTVSDAIQNIKLDTDTTTDTKQLHKKFIEYMVKQRTDKSPNKFNVPLIQQMLK